MEHHLLDTMLGVFEERGLLAQRGKQRTDSTSVIAAIRALNRLEKLGSTLRAALNSLAAAAPQWLVQVVHPFFIDCSGKRLEESRFPKGEVARKALAETIGADGMRLLDAVYSDDAPSGLAQIPAVETLRQTGLHQDYLREGQLCLREAKDLPPASLRSDSPSDP